MIEFLVIRYTIYTIAFCVIQSAVIYYLPLRYDDKEALNIILTGGLLWAIFLTIMYFREDVMSENIGELTEKIMIVGFIISFTLNAAIFAAGAAFLINEVMS